MTENMSLNDLTEISVLQEAWFKVLASRKREVVRSQGTSPSKKIIAVFGSSKIGPDSEVWRHSYRIGSEIARIDGIVINGGYGGVMEASAQGAQESGGTTIGVTCENLPVNQPNPFLDHNWDLPRWDQRLMTLVWLSDGYVVMPGASGTLVELSMVIETQLKGFIPRRPVVCVGKHWETVVKRIEGTEKMIHFVAKPETAIQMFSSS